MPGPDPGAAIGAACGGGGRASPERPIYRRGVRPSDADTAGYAAAPGDGTLSIRTGKSHRLAIE